MVIADGNAVPILPSNQDSRQQQRIALISMSSMPRPSRINSDAYRLVIDSRVFRALEPIDGDMTWLYLPVDAYARQLAGCLMITAD